jgi:hypothetical protein
VLPRGHSTDSATPGSTRAARRAGTQHASVATATTTTAPFAAPWHDSRALLHRRVERFVQHAIATGFSSRPRDLSKRAMPGEKLSPDGGHRDEFETVFAMTPYEATLIGILPHRKTGAGGAPCIHHL